jgi:hypothetical protein
MHVREWHSTIAPTSRNNTGAPVGTATLKETTSTSCVALLGAVSCSTELFKSATFGHKYDVSSEKNAVTFNFETALVPEARETYFNTPWSADCNNVRLKGKCGEICISYEIDDARHIEHGVQVFIGQCPERKIAIPVNLRQSIPRHV